jgi:hypothetical protein
MLPQLLGMSMYMHFLPTLTLALAHVRYVLSHTPLSRLALVFGIIPLTSLTPNAIPPAGQLWRTVEQILSANSTQERVFAGIDGMLDLVIPPDSSL